MATRRGVHAAGCFLGLCLLGSAAHAQSDPAQPYAYPPQQQPYSAPPQPQPAGYPAAPPGYSYYPPQPPRMPDYLPYKEGYASPPGYRLEEGPVKGLVVAGAVTTGVPYVLGLAFVAPAHFPNQSIWLLIPVVGPWMSMGARDSTCELHHDSSLCGLADAMAFMVYMMDGIMQATGAVLFTVGLTTTRRRYVREDLVSLRVLPTRIGSGYGLGALGTF